MKTNLTNMEKIIVFFPYCIRKNNKGLFDLFAGRGMFVVANAISELDVNKNYLKKDSWFQELCLRLENEIPKMTPKQAERIEILMS